MKKIFIGLLALFSISAFATPPSSRAVFQCKIGYYGKVSFHVDLSTKKVLVDEDEDANSIAGTWQVKASYEKEGKITDASKFRIDELAPIHTIILAGDNGDDTDFILTLSTYGSDPSVVGNLQEFGTVFEESETIPLKSCTMRLE